ncbi:MAG: hypothetical protein AAFW89_01055 [Bacteroidota bacterium]
MKTNTHSILIAMMSIGIIVSISFGLHAQDIGTSPFTTPEEAKIRIAKDSTNFIFGVSPNTDIIIGQNNQKTRYRSVVGFDISKIPPEADQIGLQLLLDGSGSGSGSFDVHAVSLVGTAGQTEQYERIDSSDVIGQGSYSGTTVFLSVTSTVRRAILRDTLLSGGSSNELYLGFTSRQETTVGSIYQRNVQLVVTFALPVFLTNENESGENISTTSTLTLNGEVVSSGDFKRVFGGETMNIRTNHETLQDKSTLTKHNNWNDVTTRFLLGYSDVLDDRNKRTSFAKFKPINPVTVVSRIPSNFSTTNVPVQISDPWYVDGSGNQTEPWLSYPLGFTSASMPNGGIFLNQEVINANDPIYKIRLDPDYIDAYNIQYHFIEWLLFGATLSAPDQIVNGYLETPVVFNTTGAYVFADYKPQNASGIAEVLGNDQRRKLAVDALTDDVYRVYHSRDAVWAQKMNCNAQGCSGEREFKIQLDAQAQLGEIWNASAAMSNGHLWVVYEYEYGGSYFYGITRVYDDVNPTLGPNSDQRVNNWIGGGFSDITFTAVTGRQYEANPMAAIFGCVETWQGTKPVAYGIYLDRDIDTINEPDIAFLDSQNGFTNCDGGVSLASTTNAPNNQLGFTWSDNNKVYFNSAGFIDMFLSSIPYSRTTQRLSDRDFAFSSNTNPTISRDGSDFAVAWESMWNSYEYGNVSAIAQTRARTSGGSSFIDVVE